MTPAQLIHRATMAGVIFTLTASGRMRLGGDPEAINLWLGEIGEHEAGLIAELQHQCLLGLRGWPLASDQGAGHGDVTADES